MSRGGFRGRGGGGGFGGRGRGFGRGGGFGRQQDYGPPDEVTELGVYAHPCEDQLVVRATIESVPYFNAPIYLENKQQIGKVDEILGPIREYYISINLSEDVKAGSFKKEQKLYIDPNKLLPLQRFLPKPPGQVQKRGGGRGGPRGGRGGRGGGGGFGGRGRGGRGGGGGFGGGGGGFGGGRGGGGRGGGGFRGGGGGGGRGFGRGGGGGGFRGRY